MRLRANPPERAGHLTETTSFVCGKIKRGNFADYRAH
jgi:hypothetical protein